MSLDQSSGKRTQVILIVLATIGALAILFFLGFSTLIGMAFYSVGKSVKEISEVTANPSKNTFTTPHSGSDYIAGIKLNGEINDLLADDVIEKLQAAKEDKKAIGVLLEVSSPGGAVVPSQEIYDAVKEVRGKKPIVVYVRGMAASGAYYASSPASKIVANRTSMIGSIGVIMSGFEAGKLIQFLKINPVTFKTGALKDAGSPTRPVTDADRQYLQGLLEDTHKQFEQDVVEARHTTDKTMTFMSDGRVVLAPKAMELKLIDSIGSRQLALNEIATLAHKKSPPEVFYYENIQKFSDYFAQRLGSNVSHFLFQSVQSALDPAQVSENVGVVAR